MGTPDAIATPEVLAQAGAAADRTGGVLLHVTSLPGGQGIGDLGPEAYRFIDWLAQAGQRLWQILPLGPTGYGDSPYASGSAFAGNPLLISLERLVGDGLLQEHEIAADFPGPVDFETVGKFKREKLELAAARFQSGQAYSEFCDRASYWLDDYVRVRIQVGANEAFERFIQYVFDQQWSALRRYANDRGIRIVGDIPIFVADGSVDVLAHPHLFHLDHFGRPTIVAGVPPDIFSATGQRWGNPLFRWEVMADEGYRWWRERLRRTLELVDVVRIDHFRGFAAYWAVPASEQTAVNGQWRLGPGMSLFQALSEEFGPLPLMVEDLGLITPDVVGLRERLGYPGMKVLQFAFEGKPENPYLPHNYQPNCVVYTGTHDNQTTRAWYESQPEAVQHQVRSYLGRDCSDVAWDMIRLALSSVAVMAIIPLQDILSLGDEARLNFPGKPEGNWTWRMPPGALSEELAGRLRELAAAYGRLPAAEPAAANIPPGYPCRDEPAGQYSRRVAGGTPATEPKAPPRATDRS